jgi:L-ascorbate metabolism protein UlaG (beta-lactamase superfamily)
VLYRVYISGDTLVHDDLREIPRRYPAIDLGLFHLGGTRIFGLMLTMDGKHGVEAIRIIGPETAIPIHFDDYDVFKSPLDDFRLEARVAGLDGKVHYLRHGESYRFAVGAGRLAAAASGRQRGS